MGNQRRSRVKTQLLSGAEGNVIAKRTPAREENVQAIKRWEGRGINVMRARGPRAERLR